MMARAAAGEEPMNTIHAIYENGVFRPIKPVDLPESCEVVFEPRVVNPPPDEPEDPSLLERELAWLEGLKNRTDAEVEEARRRLDALSPPPAPIPDGKTLSDMVEGTWPGGETDEQVAEALKRLS
jgi:predicted DNA-binding antitoxin AbrB/MazE fold protein